MKKAVSPIAFASVSCDSLRRAGVYLGLFAVSLLLFSSLTGVASGQEKSGYHAVPGQVSPAPPTVNTSESRIPSGIPVKRSHPTSSAEESVVTPERVLFATLLALVLGTMLFKSKWLGQAWVQGRQAKRFGRASKDRTLEVIATRRLTPMHTVVDLEWRGQRLLVACTDKAVLLLASNPSSDDISVSPSESGLIVSRNRASEQPGAQSTSNSRGAPDE